MSTFITDNLTHLTAGTTLSGTLGSDGTSLWTAATGNFVQATAGVYPLAASSVSSIEVQNRVSDNANYTVTWDVNRSGTGAFGAGWQIGVVARSTLSLNHRSLQVLLTDSGNPNSTTLYLQEKSDFSNYTNQASALVNLSAGTVHFSLSMVTGSATLTWTGGDSGTANLPSLNWLAGSIGYVGLYGLNPLAGSMTNANCISVSNLVATSSSASATLYKLHSPVDIFTGTPSPIKLASKYPASFNLDNTSIGYGNASWSGNREYTLTLDGLAPGGGFTWTPPAGYQAYDASGTASSTIVIAAGQSAARFTIAPPAGVLTSPLTISGTNGSGFANVSPTIGASNRLLLIEGDSISSEWFGANWLAPTRTSIGANWLLQSSACEYSRVDDGTTSPTHSVKYRYPTTVRPWHDPARTQEAVIIWAGTNDINASATGSATFTALQAIVIDLKSAGWKNIALGTCVDRVGIDQTQRAAYNTAIKAAYGSTGSDTSVGVIDFAANANLGANGAASNTTYFTDGTHPFTSASATIISGLVSGWVNSLPASQSISAGTLSVTSTGTGTATLGCTAPANSVGATTYQLKRTYQSGGMLTSVAGKSGTWTSGSLVFNITGLDSATYWYTVTFTDTVSSSDSNQVTVAIASSSPSSGGSITKSRFVNNT